MSKLKTQEVINVEIVLRNLKERLHAKASICWDAIHSVDKTLIASPCTFVGGLPANVSEQIIITKQKLEEIMMITDNK